VLDACRNGRLDAVVLNPGNVLGPGDRHNWSRLFRMVSTGSLPGVGPGGGNFCDVREVAKAHVEAWHRGQTGHRYLLGGEFASYLQVAAMAGEILNARVPDKPMPTWILEAVARVKNLLAAVTGKEPDLTPEGAALIIHAIRCNSDKAQRELDYPIVPLRNMVEDTIDWMNEKGLLQ
jgi:nucleoside-diphosphate-sugar epimerase